MRNIVLIGYQGVGKTYYGKKLSKVLDRTFIDTDELLESKFGESVRELYKRLGEVAFRKEEKTVIEQLYGMTNTIIATGGGVVEIKGALTLLQGLGHVVYLHNDLESLKKRWTGKGSFYQAASIEGVFERRCKMYKICCNSQVEGRWDQILLVGNLW